MINDYQPSLECIVETHMQKEEEIQIPGYSFVIKMRDHQIVEDY